ncbi:hypothetical protein [Micromonospora matsumotoense]|uniref:hypothetical protein n=1 Tax=Micromonospora matsumotoense TaxID=121616 RepID=UPI0033EFFF38
MLVFLGVGGAVRGALAPSDLFLLVAVLLCGLGYAEVGALARELGGARTICWALRYALPVTGAATLVAARDRTPASTPPPARDPVHG